MFGHDPYAAKAVEYLLGIGFLLLFAAFWQYVMSGTRLAPMHVVDQVRRRLPKVADMFRVPDDVMLHPGHAWARVDGPGLVSVGVDDFAHKLVGPAALELPDLGERVAQGEAALEIGEEDRKVPMLSPVDGTVVAVNQAARERPDGIDDPYGAGWLFKVKPTRLAANLRQLLADAPARRFLEDAGEAIALRMSPQLATVLQDGGTPIHGIARALAGDDWDQLARQHFLA
jgi:glycine cleavage system H lipoate-binding protein